MPRSAGLLLQTAIQPIGRGQGECRRLKAGSTPTYAGVASALY